MKIPNLKNGPKYGFLSVKSKQKNKQNKLKKWAFAQKFFLLTLTLTDFPAKERLFAVYSLSNSVMQTWIFSTLEM